MACLGDLLNQSMSFKVNLIGFVVDAYSFGHVYIFILCFAGYLVFGEINMKKT